MTQWNTPGGMAAASCLDMLAQPHLLIAGSTGSGKSTLIESIIYNALYQSPATVQFVLLDPKTVQLKRFSKLPHTIGYARSPAECAKMLKSCAELMEKRFATMEAKNQTQSTESNIYILIDEWVDIKLLAGKEAEINTIRIASKGRAANIHLILSTQRPTRDIINGAIKANFSSKVALRTDSKQESRNILETACAEELPEIGYAYYKTPKNKKPQLIKVPYTDPAELAARVRWWEDQKPRRRWWQ